MDDGPTPADWSAGAHIRDLYSGSSTVEHDFETKGKGRLNVRDEQYLGCSPSFGVT
jgi:hypothetical protein